MEEKIKYLWEKMKLVREVVNKHSETLINLTKRIKKLEDENRNLKNKVDVVAAQRNLDKSSGKHQSEDILNQIFKGGR
jgi:tRNA U34 5-carboxymethylaminomethyl modifying GTPase MnmE/TrmE